LETDLEKAELQKLAAIATWPLVPLMTATQAIRANLGQLIKDKSSFRLPIDRVAMAEFNQMIGLPEIEELQLKYLPQNIR
jgi:methylisocitrate lyase